MMVLIQTTVQKEWKLLMVNALNLVLRALVGLGKTNVGRTAQRECLNIKAIARDLE